jgi:TPR repeat protein
MGLLLFSGKLAPRDPVEANKWSLRAALQGVAAAQNARGYALAKGIGAETNLMEACKWLSLANAQQDPQARVNLRALKAKLTAEQIAEGESEAAAFRPKPEIVRTSPSLRLRELLAAVTPAPNPR